MLEQTDKGWFLDGVRIDRDCKCGEPSCAIMYPGSEIPMGWMTTCEKCFSGQLRYNKNPFEKLLKRK